MIVNDVSVKIIFLLKVKQRLHDMLIQEARSYMYFEIPRKRNLYKY